jgi:hypothetical protein
VLILKPYYFISILLVLLPPAIINFFWLGKLKSRVLIFALLTTILFAPPVELIARVLNDWDVQSLFFRPFGLIPLENVLFAFINFLWVISFYEYFVDRSYKKKISKKLKYLVGLYILFSVSIYSLFYYAKSLIGMNYFMLAVFVLIIPSMLIYFRHVKLIEKVVLPTIFFAIVFFIYEMVSLQIGSWWWPGHYLYTFKFAGRVFPLDDIIIWYFLSTPALIGGYEFFVDDYK